MISGYPKQRTRGVKLEAVQSIVGYMLAINCCFFSFFVEFRRFSQVAILILVVLFF